MRGMKKILVLMLLYTTLVGIPSTNPTLTTLKWNSSEILSDSEGKRLIPYIKPFKLFPSIKSEYIEDRIFEIHQIDDNSFLVLGSPIEWEDNYVK